jgi:hypothetical protein
MKISHFLPFELAILWSSALLAAANGDAQAGRQLEIMTRLRARWLMNPQPTMPGICSHESRSMM